MKSVLAGAALSDDDAWVLTADGDDWQMSFADRCAFAWLVSAVRPEVAIEVGTFRGGSLRVLRRHAKQVYSLDISDEPRARLAASSPNVEFVVGSSRQTLPELLTRLTGRQIDFVLIDGDHTAEGVTADIRATLAYRPVSRPTFVLMHDSFNPAVRRGILAADWAACPWLHFVGLDFTPGDLVPSCRQLWGGLALAVMRPEPRPGEFRPPGQGSRLAFEACLPHHREPRPRLRDRARRVAARSARAVGLGGVASRLARRLGLA